MDLRMLACAFVALPLAAGTAAAQQRLSPAQMDRMTAGDASAASLPVTACASCTVATSTSMSVNGVTTTTSSTQTTGGGGTGTGGGGTGSGGGGTGSGGGSGGGSGAPSLLGLTVTVPPSQAAILGQASVATVTSP